MPKLWSTGGYLLEQKERTIRMIRVKSWIHNGKVENKISIKGKVKDVLYETMAVIGSIKRNVGNEIGTDGDKIFLEMIRRAIDDPESPINKGGNT